MGWNAATAFVGVAEDEAVCDGEGEFVRVTVEDGVEPNEGVPDEDCVAAAVGDDVTSGVACIAD